jgi:hypothetical protein
MRPTPFGVAFGEIARRFPAIAEALQQEGAAPDDRDRFVLLEPVGRLLGEIIPEGAGAEALETHVLLLHTAFLHWASGGAVYRIGEQALQRAIVTREITGEPPHPALYLQIPELRVWGSPTPEAAPEPLDGMFVSHRGGEGGGPGTVAVLAIFGMRPDRPGFSAVGIEGRADSDEAAENEIEVAAAREDGSAPFGPMLAGGSAAGLHSVANAGELLLLTCRLLTLLPGDESEVTPVTGGALERIVAVE